MLYNLIRLPLVARQPLATDCQPVHGPVAAFMLTGRDEPQGDEGTQTTRIYGVSVSRVCMSVLLGL